MPIDLTEKQESRQKINNFHLAGIIPAECQPLDFNMPWNDCLIPINKNYLAIERSVVECAYAGCETIWIVCSRETTPFIRHRIGDWIHDPVINVKVMKAVFAPSRRLKQIPIFYIPIHPKDKEKRTGLAWSILYGYNRAHNISRLFSRWATPSKYYVSFPHGIYKPSQLQKIRKPISSANSMCLSSPKGKTVKDGELLAFTFDSNEYSLMKTIYKEEEKYLWKSGAWKDGRFVGEKLSVENRFTGRFIKPQQLVKNINFLAESTFPVYAYNNISSWDSYCEFLGSSARNLIGQRPNSILKYKEFNPIAEDLEDDLSDFVEG